MKNDNDVYWGNPRNWRWALFYVCKDDPRVIVPKRLKWMGRTLNFAHRKAFGVLAGTFALIALPLLLRKHMQEGPWQILLISILLGIVIFYYSCDLRSNAHTSHEPRKNRTHPHSKQRKPQ